MFFFRAAFWLALVVAFIPVREGDLADGQKTVSTMETVGLAQSVASDISTFCDRNPGTCETGGALFSQMGLKAREGARLAHSWLDQRFGKDDTQKSASVETIDPVTTATTAE